MSPAEAAIAKVFAQIFYAPRMPPAPRSPKFSQEFVEKFDLLIEAFNVLSNTKKRKAYDEMLAKREARIPVVISEKEEETYEEWQKEAKKKSKKSWDADLTDLLLLDLFIDGSLFGMFDGFDDLIGDTLGDVFDLF